jgi:hypothetical protein
VSLGSFSPGSDSAGALLLSPASRALLGRAAAGAPAAKALQVAALEGAAAAGALGNPTGSGGGDGGGGADQDDLRTEEEERALKAWRRKRNKQSTRWELFVLHLTSDGWAFTDFIIALLIFVVLVLRFAYVRLCLCVFGVLFCNSFWRDSLLSPLPCRRMDATPR